MNSFMVTDAQMAKMWKMSGVVVRIVKSRKIRLRFRRKRRRRISWLYDATIILLISK